MVVLCNRPNFEFRAFQVCHSLPALRQKASTMKRGNGIKWSGCRIILFSKYKIVSGSQASTSDISNLVFKAEKKQEKSRYKTHKIDLQKPYQSFSSLHAQRALLILLPSQKSIHQLARKPWSLSDWLQELNDKRLTMIEGSALSERDLLRARAEGATACLLLADRFSPKPEEEDLNLQFQVLLFKRCAVQLATLRGQREFEVTTHLHNQSMADGSSISSQSSRLDRDTRSTETVVCFTCFIW